MAILAIRGHEKRYREVIALLEMLGARNALDLTGYNDKKIYYISSCGYIDYCYPDKEYRIYTLKQFYKKFPYKVGNKVLVKGYESPVDILEMTWNGSEIEYRINIEDDWLTADELQPYKEETMEEDLNYCRTGKITTVIFQEQNYEDKVELDLGDNYEIKVEDGKTYVVRKKPKYPKTYEECCDVLNISLHNSLGITRHIVYDYISPQEEKLFNKISSLYKLLICRNAYWKLANDWSFKLGSNIDETVYAITHLGTGRSKCFYHSLNCNKILVFPTEDMRDQFDSNFDEDIKLCKEYL